MSAPPYANPSTLKTTLIPKAQTTVNSKGNPAQAIPFLKFSDSVKLRWDDAYFYVESNGMPDHSMMVGITAWQQQIPLPQPYMGDNAWRIPLHPIPARTPMSAKKNFFRGAIAVAANGVPIFNPIKNDGRTDTFLAGELDKWGGHCGRADDYHYHIAPVHLQQRLGKDKPLAYALDGYPIYGYEEPDGSPVTGLDEFNGHKDTAGNYHYHATKSYPYVNGGFYGKVTERNGQVDPQPRAHGMRPALTPLRGAKITKFHSEGSHYHLHYDLGGQSYALNYEVQDDRSVTIERVDPSGISTTETHSGKRQGGGPGGKQKDRKSWISAHKEELDRNSDGDVTLVEMMNEAKKVFRSYDANNDGEISAEESKGPGVKSAMGGFVRGHFEEIDRNSSGAISARELADNAKKMFSKADANSNGKIEGEEYNRSAGGGKRKGEKGGDGRNKRAQK
ncbi:YHYH protein [Verrucomicrobiaceae bacterium N1E253]|uniref:YHYH protein n=2 Tax=Oceaniferula marina TaxID=2748318 RepID=A0A851GRU6_9BACT|nr:YHYH protein [Oceaniferula marina]